MDTVVEFSHRPKVPGGPLAYALVTPARNEAALIEGTIRSVVAQTRRPVRWAIVSDGSTDDTDDIVRRHAAKHDWIELVRMPERKERHFAGKVHAFNAGFARVRDLPCEIIGSLDADITFAPDYFEFLLSRFAADERLGVAGTPFQEHGVGYNYHFTSIEHVSGACQMFRRACFDAIGGYSALKVGGIDLVAVTTARMRGWKTRTFVEKVSEHHRKMGSGNHRPLMAAYKSGYHDYLMGVHPVWQTFRSIYQMGHRPYGIGGLLLWVGFVWAALKRAERPVTSEFVRFRRREQMDRLARFFHLKPAA